MERRWAHQKSYDWPELRGLVPNASSPQPRLAMATYGAKAAAPGGSVQPSTQLLPQAQQPKKPLYAWHRTKHPQPNAAPAQITSPTTSPSMQDLPLEIFAPQSRTSTIAVRREQSNPMTHVVDAQALPITKRTITKNPAAVLKRISESEAVVSARGKETGEGVQRSVDVRQEAAGQPGKQWVFQMPTTSNMMLELSGSDDEGARDATSRIAPHTKTASRVAALMGTQSGASGAPRIGAHWHESTGNQVSRRALPKRRPQNCTSNKTLSKVDDLQIEGNAFSDANATNALLALESHVARERRAREELLSAHRQVLQSFRQVVRSFFTTIVDDQHAKRCPAAVSLAKCSVVVHTLIATIQLYVRVKQSQKHVMMRRLGHASTLAERLHLSNKSLPTLLSVEAIGARGDYTPVTAGTNSEDASELSTTHSSVHDLLLDHETISRLKQLYFDYYDCETFVLEGTHNADSTTKVLPFAGGSSDMRRVIEETNVLEEVADDEVDEWRLDEHHEDPSEYIPEELPSSSPTASRERTRVSPRLTSAASLMLNESTAMRDIFGSPRTASDLGSPCSYLGNPPECEVEDL